MKEKIKILILSDSPFSMTGFATISKNIANRLPKDKYDVYYLAHNFLGQDVMPGVTFEDGEKLDFTILGQGSQPYCGDIIEWRIKTIKPDIFFVLLDTFMLMQANYLNKNISGCNSLMYYPSDGGGKLPLGCEDILKKFNYSVAMGRFGQRQVKDVHGLETFYIPHAVDTKNYYPLNKKEKDELRKKYNLKDKFVVGCVSRNQGRKMLDRLIKTFSIFAKDKDDVVLFLHTDPKDLAQPFQLIELIKNYELNNKVVFSGMKYFRGFETSRMNEVYNLMDVFFLSTSGEGFGVPTIEAAACGIPSVVTNYTTTHELLIEDGKCGLPVKLVGTETIDYSNQNLKNQKLFDTELANGTITGSWNVERGIMDINHGAKCLQQLYDNKDLRINLGKVGRRKVLKYYDWDVVMKQWTSLFESMVNVK